MGHCEPFSSVRLEIAPLGLQLAHSLKVLYYYWKKWEKKVIVDLNIEIGQMYNFL